VKIIKKFEFPKIFKVKGDTNSKIILKIWDEGLFLTKKCIFRMRSRLQLLDCTFHKIMIL